LPDDKRYLEGRRVHGLAMFIYHPYGVSSGMNQLGHPSAKLKHPHFTRMKKRIDKTASILTKFYKIDPLKKLPWSRRGLSRVVDSTS
jgi:hypothetical protein